MRIQIHDIGSVSGTIQQFAFLTKIKPANFGRRLAKFKAGKYTAEQTLKVGALPKLNSMDRGNEEWQNLSNLIKDARSDVLDLPDNWLRRGAGVNGNHP